jgi:hypothetical protein
LRHDKADPISSVFITESKFFIPIFKDDVDRPTDKPDPERLSVRIEALDATKYELHKLKSEAIVPIRRKENELEILNMSKIERRLSELTLTEPHSDNELPDLTNTRSDVVDANMLKLSTERDPDTLLHDLIDTIDPTF